MPISTAHLSFVDIFVIDEEAEEGGIPTEEYRKTHPWSGK
jgi:hypothetical protein